MIIPDGQIWMLHHTGTAYYWTRWLDAPLRDDRVVVMGLPCRVVAVVDDACGESKVFVERVWIDDVQVKSIKVVVMPPDGLGKAEVAV